MTKQVTYTRKATNTKTPFTCIVCGESGLGRVGSMYCTNKCKQRNKNERAKEGKDG